VRLAPLYDIASYLPYDVPPWHDVRLAMRVHNEYQIKRITLHDWLRMGRKAGFDDDTVVERIRSIIARLPDAVADEVARATAAHLDAAVLAVLADRMRLRVRECSQRIEAAAEKT
jgi:serine/threonine protein kinase HipA of HipAB toxin-antitoxin module